MYNKLCSFENLLLAFLRARQNKANKYYVIKFEQTLEENLLKLQHELLTQTYQPKPLKTFIIRDPKTRKISKSRFRDRVVHHALINVIGDIFEKSFIYDSHANQIGKGTLKAIERFDFFKRKVSKNGTQPCYVLKADIKHYFEEINHEILLSIIGKKIKDDKILWLIDKILKNNAVTSEGGANALFNKKGMPLGNYTSQFFANVYLNDLDQFVKNELKVKHYIRYVDDFVMLHNSKSQLADYMEKINIFLQESLGLMLHPFKSKILNLEEGVPFLGFKIFLHHKTLRNTNIRKFQSKLRELKVLYREKQLNREQVVECLEGWMAYAKQGNTYKYRRNLLRTFNKYFPIRNKNEIIISKKIKNFFRKYYSSKVEFSSQKTLLLLRKGLSIQEIYCERGIKEATIWRHIINLVEHGQLPIWNVLPKKKIVYLLQRIKSSSEPLKQIKEQIYDKNVTYDDIACIRAHVKMKEKIRIA